MTKYVLRLAAAVCLFCPLFAEAQPAAAQFAVQDGFPNLRFQQPVDLAADGLGALYIVEREGRIYAFENDSTTSEKSLFLDVSDLVLTEPVEAGLLGLAFHPNHGENGYFYVYYVADSPLRSVLVRYTRSEEDPLLADESSEHIILEIDQPTARHNGGDISFDSDGYLLLSLGDGSQGKDSYNNAQNLETLLGSIIRIDVDNPSDGRNYGVPPDNPFVGNLEGHREEIFAYGFRNPWRFSIDPVKGNIWVGDVGEVTWEKIAVAVKGGNSGWPIVEGPDCYRPPENCVREDLIPPVHYYHHDEGISVTGGYVYHGNSVPELKGKYLFADWSSSKVYTISYTGDSPLETGSDVTVELIMDNVPRVSAFGVDENQELYMLSLFQGVIYRFEARTAQNTDPPGLPGNPTLSIRLDGPNPFSSTTKFVLEAASTQRVTVAVYDVLGRQVELLFDGHILGGTPQEVSLDGSLLPPGVYFVRALSARAVLSRTVVVAR